MGGLAGTLMRLKNYAAEFQISRRNLKMAWLQKQMGYRNLTMLIRHYWRWINPGELRRT
jgi:hypothetical protein